MSTVIFAPPLRTVEPPAQSPLTEISFKATDAAVDFPSKKKVTDENNSFVT
jgi:hypothetical protein